MKFPRIIEDMSIHDGFTGLGRANYLIPNDEVEVTETDNAVKVHSDKPHLVSLGSGRLSTAITIIPLLEGRTEFGTVMAPILPDIMIQDRGRTEFGRVMAPILPDIIIQGRTEFGTVMAPILPDIIIQGTGVEDEHCFIENIHGSITFHPVARMCAIDGMVVDKPMRLAQGCMICLGRSNYFRFNHPQEAKKIKDALPNCRISCTPINFLQENHMDVEMVAMFSDADINDVFPNNFRDRFIIRRIIESNKIKTGEQNPDIKCVVDKPIYKTDTAVENRKNQSESSNSVIHLENSKFTVEEMMEKKIWRGKPTAAQLHFHSVLKDAAIASHIWKTAPVLENISSKKRESFFEKIDLEEPLLTPYRGKVWTRLGQNLQNRRKYLRDVAAGKRNSKTAVGAAKSPAKSRSPKVKSTPAKSKSPKVTKSKSPAKVKPTMVNKSTKSPPPKVNKSTKSPKVKSPNRSGDPRKNLAKATLDSVQIGARVTILSKYKETLGTGIFLRRRNEMFAEVVIHTLKNSESSTDIELPECTTSGATTFGEIRVKDTILWKMEYLSEISRSNQATNKKTQAKKHLNFQGHDGSEAVAPKAATTLGKCSVVIMEWNHGELYMGMFDSMKNIVQNCRKPIGRIIAANKTDGSAADYCTIPDVIMPAMRKLNNLDIQKNPDMDFLIWMIDDDRMTTYIPVEKTINLKNENDFLIALKRQVEKYLN